MTGHPTPEEAVRADSVPARFVRIVAVEHSPDQRFAVVLVEYGEPPSTEPYVVLCERTADGWEERQAGSGGGLSWMATGESGGVEVEWGRSPAATWDAPPRTETERPLDAGRW